MRLSARRRTPALLAITAAALVLTAGTAETAAAAAPHSAGILASVVRGAHATGATTVVAAAAAQERSAPVTVMLVGVGAVVGVIVGLVPAVLVATLLGYLPPPRRRARLAGVLVEPERAPPGAWMPAVPTVVPAPGPVPAAAAAPDPGAPDPPTAPLAILAHARHQSVYDAAYAEQLERVETLRAAIGGRRRPRPEPPAQ